MAAIKQLPVASTSASLSSWAGQLPPEILLLIAEHAMRELEPVPSLRKTGYACSLVCRSWVPLGRTLLYNDIEVLPEGRKHQSRARSSTSHKLGKALARHEHLGRFVRRLETAEHFVVRRPDAAIQSDEQCVLFDDLLRPTSESLARSLRWSRIMRNVQGSLASLALTDLVLLKPLAKTLRRDRRSFGTLGSISLELISAEMVRRFVTTCPGLSVSETLSACSSLRELRVSAAWSDNDEVARISQAEAEAVWSFDASFTKLESLFVKANDFALVGEFFRNVIASGVRSATSLEISDTSGNISSAFMRDLAHSLADTAPAPTLDRLHIVQCLDWYAFEPILDWDDLATATKRWRGGAAFFRALPRLRELSFDGLANSLEPYLDACPPTLERFSFAFTAENEDRAHGLARTLSKWVATRGKDSRIRRIDFAVAYGMPAPSESDDEAVAHHSGAVKALEPPEALLQLCSAAGIKLVRKNTSRRSL